MIVTLFGNRLFADDQVKMTSSGWALIQYDRHPYKRGNLDTETHTEGEQCETGRRQPSTNQGERPETDPQILPSQLSERTHLPDTLISDF